jgi:phenylpropionate dioxygenase-like ring-hydroxylating dioxygenase large terminal subunit
MKRASIDAYRVDERYGLVFVFLGDLPEDERATIMPCAEYDQEGWAVPAVPLLKGEHHAGLGTDRYFV